MTEISRIAMWSGPRNISTAMMRAFENRTDCWVMDEPFYAHYLKETGIDHPMAVKIIANGEIDAAQVIGACTNGTSPPLTVQYQKQMCHHMLPAMSMDWLAEVNNCFLIRHPRDVVASYAAKRQQVAIEDLGFQRQCEIFELATVRYRQSAIVLEARDVLSNPRATLMKLCEALAIPFNEKMLAWPAGKRRSDGIWASHWYSAVEASTGFAPPQPPQAALKPALEEIVEACLPFYEKMAMRKLKP